MHKSLANIGRVWIATTLLNSHIPVPHLTQLISQPIPQLPSPPAISTSCLYSLIPWSAMSSLPHPPHPTDQISRVPTNTPPAESSLPTLNPLAPSFTPHSTPPHSSLNTKPPLFSGATPSILRASAKPFFPVSTSFPLPEVFQAGHSPSKTKTTIPLPTQHTLHKYFSYNQPVCPSSPPTS
jgi:hypothetical protein